MTGVTGGGGLAAWRFASRLAWREVRRRPGRTVLVAVLVALPVLAMTAASVWARSADVAAVFRGWRAGTDIVVDASPRYATNLTALVPAGSSVHSALVAQYTPIETAAGDEIDGVTIAGGTGDPSDSRVFTMTGGRAPASGEAWLSSPLAARLGIRVGDELALAHPHGTWTVSGVGRFDDDFDRPGVVLDRLPLEEFRPNSVAQRVSTIDLPGSPSPGKVRSVGSSLQQRLGDNFSVQWPDNSDGERVTAEGMAWGWVAGVIALAAMGVIIAAAFATSARRQLVTIGLLLANGASASLTRRALSLHGFWTGVVGSLGGIGIGLIGLIAGRSTVERIVGHVLSPYQFATADLVVIGLTGIAAATIAALVPARTATHVPVTAALAGRRPLAAVPRRLVPFGIALFGFGTFLLVVAASSKEGGNAAAAAAVAGGVLVTAGACCASPLAIDTMSRVSARIGRSWRFAGRSLGRTRYRSAAVVTAIAITAAAAVAGSAVALSADQVANVQRLLPADAVVLNQYLVPPAPTGRPRMLDYTAAPDRPVDAALQQQVDAIIPSAEWSPLRIATWDPKPFPVRRSGPRSQGRGFALTPDLQLVVADPAVVDLYELGDADRATLESTGALELNPYSDNAIDSIALVTEDGEITVPVAARQWVSEYREHPYGSVHFDGVTGLDPFMITEAAARRAGLDIVTRGAVVRSAGSLTDGQRSALDALISNGDPLGFYYRDVPRPDQSSPWSVVYDQTDWRPPPAAVQAAIVLAALLLTLLVVAIGLSLSATESRDERDVLVAIGARPATLRRMAGVKAAVITLTASMLAIPTGLIPVAAVKRTLDDPFVVPWLAIAGLVLVVPVLAGLAAWGVSSIAQRARPAHISALAFE